MIVGHIDTSERSNVPIYAAADCAASGEKSSGKDLAQAKSTPQTLAAAVQASLQLRAAETVLADLPVGPGGKPKPYWLLWA